jgi:prepilin-type processing-associated H-X9-DG protein
MATTTHPTSPEHPGRPTARHGRARRRLTRGFIGAAGSGLLALILLPSLCKLSEAANRAKCAANLLSIGLALQLYQQDNGGTYPDTLGQLAENEQIASKVFTCPSSNDEASASTAPAAVAADIDAGPAGHHCSYVYIGRGLTAKTVTDATVLCYEPPDNHDGTGCNVLYGDGHVEWLTKAEAATRLPATVPREAQ